MIDLIRRSAANLLAISLTMAAEPRESREDTHDSGDQITAHLEPRALPIDEVNMDLEQK